MKQILIMGAGRIGRAIGSVLTERGNAVSYWDVVKDIVPDQRPLAELVPGADVIILSLPSWAARESILSICPVLKPTAIVLTFAKGIEEKTRMTMDALLKENLPNHRWGIIGGPVMAEEIMNEKGAAAAIGADEETYAAIEPLFGDSAIRLEHVRDIRGAAVSGMLKNLYALGFGIADGLGWGMNLKGWLATIVLKEMQDLGIVLGAQPGTVLGTVGLGDLICTSFSPYSRNRSVGEELIRTGKTKVKSESTVSFPVLMEILGERAANFPVLSGIWEVLRGAKPAQEVFDGFLVLRYPPSAFEIHSGPSADVAQR